MTPKDSSNWLVVRVELLSGSAQDFDPPPGRDFLVDPQDSFGQLADAINSAFARWDISHLHEFRVPDDTAIGIADTDWADEQDVEDEKTVELGSRLKKGDEFTYSFDFGDDWTHRCTVLRDDFDADQEFGGPPDTSPIPIFGWGSIPDQYGRDRPIETD